MALGLHPIASAMRPARHYPLRSTTSKLNAEQTGGRALPSPASQGPDRLGRLSGASETKPPWSYRRQESA